MFIKQSLLFKFTRIFFIVFFGMFILAATDGNRTFYPVHKVRYKGDLGELNGKTIEVRDSTVAFASEVRIKSPVSFVMDTQPPAIFFIIDNSSSMSWSNQNDQYGSRFRVTHDLIDTINKKFGNKAEVGVSVFTRYLFYNPDNDVRFKKCPNYDTGSYIPLLKLSVSYPPDGKTGYDLLKYYLDTALYTKGTTPYVDLKYQPKPPWPKDSTERSTNINAAFDCAKDAFKNTTFPKQRHFIIFLSDGEANVSQIQGVTPTDYVNGKDVPTTFTVYFTKTGVGLNNLNTMTRNIRSNGYSIRNPSSNLWNINTNYDTLMKILRDSVLNVIAQSIQSKPISLTINNLTVTNWNQTNQMFTFGALFPLTGVKTDFDYLIKYTIVKDSLGTIIQKDSSTKGNFSIVIKSGVQVPDTFEIKTWMREIAFYGNNVVLNSLNETNRQVEVRFTCMPGSSGYSYTNVPLEITTTMGSAQDKEVFPLVNKVAYFSCTFPIAISSSPKQGDGTLQVQPHDTIWTVFRNSENPRLPLDTLKVKIAYDLSGDLHITDGYYYDNSGDGFIDKIIIKADKKITNDQATEILTYITLPSFRKFSAPTNSVLVDSGAVSAIVLSVSQDKAALGEPTTYVTGDDVLKVASVLLNSGGMLGGNDNVPIHDKIAPIIMSARAKVAFSTTVGEVIKDTLTVKFSEPVKPITAPDPFQPFYCIRHDGSTVTTYVPTLIRDNSSSPSDQMKFIVNDFNNPSITHFVKNDPGVPKNDSIWITWQYNYVGDQEINYQRYETNTRRLVEVDLIIPNIEIQIISTNPFIINSNINNQNTNQINKIINILDPVNIQEIKKINNQGIVIQILPPDTAKKKLIDSLTGTLDIYDALGNLLMKSRKMGYNPVNKTLNFVWTGKNTKGRNVGAGTYLVVAKIKAYYLQGYSDSKMVKTFLGIKVD